MAKINLLPWREELRREKTRQFASVTAFSVVLTLCVIALIHVMINGQIDYQNKRNQVLKDEITQLDIALKEIEGLEDTKDKLLSRMDIIQSLQQKRPQVVHLFDELVRTVPEGIYLTGIKQTHSELTINGVAESNGRVSAYMRNIDASEWMSTPKLTVIETKPGTLRSSNFVLTTSTSSPKEDEEDKS
jgi:type IV pilus assembly protein PilN